jgi:hypothetical protein
MVVGYLFQSAVAKDGGHLRFERLCEQSVDVVVAVIDKYKAAVVNVLLKVLLLTGCKFHELVPAEITKRGTEDVIAVDRHHMFLRIDLQRGVFDKAVQNVGWHALIHIPVTGRILEAREKEIVILGHRDLSFSHRLRLQKSCLLHINGKGQSSEAKVLNSI